MKEKAIGRRILAVLALVILVLGASGGRAWAQIPQFKIENPDIGNQITRMGHSVAVDGDTMVAGAPYTNVNGLAKAGVARVYQKDGLSSWTFQAKLVASDVAASHMFGQSLAISDDTAVVGAFFDSDGGSNSGSAYVFTRSGGVWSEQQKLTASDAQGGDYFGIAVAIDGKQVIVGSSSNDDPEIDSGSAYAFDITQYQIIFYTDGTPGATLSGTTIQTVITGDDCTPITANAPASHQYCQMDGRRIGLFDRQSVDRDERGRWDHADGSFCAFTC